MIDLERAAQEAIRLREKAPLGEWASSHRERSDGMWATEIYDVSGETIATLAWYALPQKDGSTTTSRSDNAAFLTHAGNHYDEIARAYLELLGKQERTL